MTCSRSRIGSACTAANPACWAAAANRGQRRAAAARSAASMGWPARKQSRQGPWSFCIWNSSSTRAASLEAATTRSSPRGSASSSPAAEASSSCMLRSVSTCRKSMTSKPATMVSVSSTNVCDSSSPSIPAHPLRERQQDPPGCAASGARAGGCGIAHAGPPVDGSGSGTQPQAARHDVAGQIGQRPVMSCSYVKLPGRAARQRWVGCRL
jgi:hypothetical protein